MANRSGGNGDVSVRLDIRTHHKLLKVQASMLLKSGEKLTLPRVVKSLCDGYLYLVEGGK